uniref:DUF4283 domain-containing protein n=1 Tax=Cajanus cajan TaxID=3821 RepID=A0A151S0S6_CAJCA|nr:hypothetical protein KK1_029897 [Cajanus cajan]
MLLPKGASPYKFHDLKMNLGNLWKLIRDWCIISLGKGYFEFSFSIDEDRQQVLIAGSWNILSRVL